MKTNDLFSTCRQMQQRQNMYVFCQLFLFLACAIVFLYMFPFPLYMQAIIFTIFFVLFIYYCKKNVYSLYKIVQKLEQQGSFEGRLWTCYYIQNKQRNEWEELIWQETKEIFITKKSKLLFKQKYNLLSYYIFLFILIFMGGIYAFQGTLVRTLRPHYAPTLHAISELFLEFDQPELSSKMKTLAFQWDDDSITNKTIQQQLKNILEKAKTTLNSQNSTHSMQVQANEVLPQKQNMGEKSFLIDKQEANIEYEHTAEILSTLQTILESFHLSTESTQNSFATSQITEANNKMKKKDSVFIEYFTKTEDFQNKEKNKEQMIQSCLPRLDYSLEYYDMIQKYFQKK
ncbi:MAG TPA: hypothetical protein P5543_06975 [Planctomycetota bacterium]|nr:hypothetical protein [Planctomycetota bacterium]HRU51915.1 hypothetical protein [Planctomycetota bacterium]